ncbi:hypothetical protein BKI52_03005 [marine bacterium AO1-C]|nr:hypothetical protein BKI52_03005 [marine bacterium AO1-C]
MANQLKLQLMKAGLAVGATFTPTSVMHYLWTKMFTIRKRSLKPPHQQLLEEAVIQEMSVALFGQDSQKIVTYQWGQGAKTVLLLHGWESKAVDYYKLIPRLLDAGYQVLSLDFPAHGNSSGSQSSLPEFIMVLKAYLKQASKVDAIIAHSLGGTAAFTWLLEEAENTNEIQLQKLILMGSPFVPVRFFEGAFDFLGVHRRVRKRFYQKAKTKFGRGIQEYSLPTLDAGQLQAEVFGLYDDSDRVVNIKEAKTYHENNPQLHMHYFQGIGHHQMIKNEAIIQTCLKILNSHTPN